MRYINLHLHYITLHYISHSVTEGQQHNNPLNPYCFCLQQPFHFCLFNFLCQLNKNESSSNLLILISIIIIITWAYKTKVNWLHHGLSFASRVIGSEILVLFHLLFHAQQLWLKFVAEARKSVADVVCQLLVQYALKVRRSHSVGHVTVPFMHTSHLDITYIHHWQLMHRYKMYNMHSKASYWA